MFNSAWHPTLLIRASVALHGLALVAAIAEPAQWRWALGAVVINHLLLTAVGLWPRSNWLGPNWTRLPGAAAARNEIALTIDDGPDPPSPRSDGYSGSHATRTFFGVLGEIAHAIRTYAGKSSAAPCVENHSHTSAIIFTAGPARFHARTAGRTKLPRAVTVCARVFSRPCRHAQSFSRPLWRDLLDARSWSARWFDTRSVTPACQYALCMVAGGRYLLLHDGNAARSHVAFGYSRRAACVLESAAAAGLRFVRLRDALL